MAQFEERSAKKCGINAGYYLTADDEVIVFVGVSNGDLLGEIIDEKENNGEEEVADEDVDLSDSLLTTYEALQPVKSV